MRQHDFLFIRSYFSDRAAIECLAIIFLAVNVATVQIHQPCMLAATFLTSLAFILVFVGVKRYSKVRFVSFPDCQVDCN